MNKLSESQLAEARAAMLRFRTLKADATPSTSESEGMWQYLQVSEQMFIQLMNGQQPPDSDQGNIEYGPVLYLANNHLADGCHRLPAMVRDAAFRDHSPGLAAVGAGDRKRSRSGGKRRLADQHYLLCRSRPRMGPRSRVFPRPYRGQIDLRYQPQYDQSFTLRTASRSPSSATGATGPWQDGSL